MSEPIPAALSAAEWTGVLANRSSLDSIRDQFLDTPFSPHALAALLLFDEPFGFSSQDVDDEREVAAYCRAMTIEHKGRGQGALALTFQLLGERTRFAPRKSPPCCRRQQRTIPRELLYPSHRRR